MWLHLIFPPDYDYFNFFLFLTNSQENKVWYHNFPRVPGGTFVLNVSQISHHSWIQVIFDKLSSKKLTFAYRNRMKIHKNFPQKLFHQNETHSETFNVWLCTENVSGDKFYIYTSFVMLEENFFCSERLDLGKIHLRLFIIFIVVLVLFINLSRKIHSTRKTRFS